MVSLTAFDRLRQALDPSESVQGPSLIQMAAAEPSFLERNSAYALPLKGDGYQTKLAPGEEREFLEWVKQNKVPFDPSPEADYDMRGFWKGAKNGDPRASMGPNPNDNQMHYDDYWKTPYHESFSNESQWATPDAPAWNDLDQLIDKNGNVVFDERAKAKARKK